MLTSISYNFCKKYFFLLFKLRKICKVERVIGPLLSISFPLFNVRVSM